MAVSFASVSLVFRYRCKGTRVFIDSIRYDSPDSPWFDFELADRALENHKTIQAYLKKQNITLKAAKGTQQIRLKSDDFLDYYSEQLQVFKFGDKPLAISQAESTAAYKIEENPSVWLKVCFVWSTVCLVYCLFDLLFVLFTFCFVYFCLLLFG